MRHRFRLARHLLPVFSFHNCLHVLGTCFISLKLFSVPKTGCYAHLLPKEGSHLPKFHYILEFGGKRPTTCVPRESWSGNHTCSKNAHIVVLFPKCWSNSRITWLFNPQVVCLQLNLGLSLPVRYLRRGQS